MAFNSPELVAGLLDQIESSTFNRDVYDKTGIFIMRGLLPEALVKEWKAEWDEFYQASLATGRNVNVNNPVDLKEKLPEKLATLYRNNILLDIAEQVFGKNVALNNHRFVIKDKFSLGEVFLHQDYCYNLGFPNKASFFVPLSYAGKKNGMLTFYAGTHKYGYLADAGEIDPSYFKEKWPMVTPELQPGDFAIMNNCLWHSSGDNVAGIDRILADIILQPADDPSGKELLRGEWQTDIFIDRENPMKIFKKSRVTKIVDLTKNQKTA